MDHDRPRLINNAAGVLHLNSLYGVSLRPGHRRLGKDLLPIVVVLLLLLLVTEWIPFCMGKRFDVLLVVLLTVLITQ